MLHKIAGHEDNAAIRLQPRSRKVQANYGSWYKAWKETETLRKMQWERAESKKSVPKCSEMFCWKPSEMPRIQRVSRAKIVGLMVSFPEEQSPDARLMVHSCLLL